jgi:prepilin-type N-terminal cleavage/methylation domain-containing protein
MKAGAGQGRGTGFTLIEMLTVMAVIGVLASLLLIAVTRAREKARREKASAEVRELGKAWKAYWGTYGTLMGWPYTGPKEMDAGAMRILLGIDKTRNPLGLVLMDSHPKTADQGFKDPWGNLYKVDFSSSLQEGIERYETAVTFPNRKRYLHESR